MHNISTYFNASDPIFELFCFADCWLEKPFRVGVVPKSHSLELVVVLLDAVRIQVFTVPVGYHLAIRITFLGVSLQPFPVLFINPSAAVAVLWGFRRDHLEKGKLLVGQLEPLI